MRSEKTLITEKCDRCGKEEVGLEHIIRKRHIVSLAIFVPMHLVNPGYVENIVNYKGLDLCKDCYKSFSKWFNDKGEK